MIIRRLTGRASTADYFKKRFLQQLIYLLVIGWLHSRDRHSELDTVKKYQRNNSYKTESQALCAIEPNSAQVTFLSRLVSQIFTAYHAPT